MNNEEMLKLILNKFDKLEDNIQEIKSNQNEIKSDIKQLKNETETLGLKINKMDKDLTEVKSNTKILEKKETKRFLNTGSKIISVLSES
jgi:peptidoglycan hydrolase CwlO-like protein